MSTKDHNAIILVGGPGQSMLRKAAGHPVCLLPVPGKKSLLHSWMDTLRFKMNVRKICVVTGRSEDVETINAHVGSQTDMQEIDVSIHADRASHRGTAGALKDFVESRDDFDDVIMIEGNRIPPEYPEALLSDEFQSEEVMGILGKSSQDETAGMILMKRRMLDLVPDLGFFDFKEQLIPRVIDSGSKILVKEITRRSVRLSTPSTYLKQITDFATSGSCDRMGPFVSRSADVDPKSVLGNNVIVGDNVTIMGGCLIQDSVILEGSVIESDSTLVRSIISRNSRIEEGTSSIIDPYNLDNARNEVLKRRIV